MGSEITTAQLGGSVISERLLRIKKYLLFT